MFPEHIITMNNNHNIAKIDQRLFIGSYEAAIDIQLLRSLSITKVLSLDTVKPVLDHSLIQLFICVSDEASSDILSELPRALEFLDKGARTLVHCRHGVSRSAAVVVARMMMDEGIGVESALEKLVIVREQCRPNDGFMKQLQLFREMGCKVDTSCTAYINYALQHGVVKVTEAPKNAAAAGDVTYKCKKCRKLLALGHHVINHAAGLFPDWWSAGPEVAGSCRQGVFMVPPSWLGHSQVAEWSGVHRLDCYGCGAKIGCWGEASCGCGAKGDRGVCINLNRVDKGGGSRVVQRTN